MRIFTGLAIAALCLATGMATAGTDVRVVYLHQEIPPAPTLSNLDPVPPDLGVAGAALGLADNKTTGRFLGQSWQMQTVTVPHGGDWADAARTALRDTDFVILDAPAPQVLAAADLPEAAGALLFNVSAPDARLRDADCRANLLHTGASLAMRSDALMQVLLAKRWTRLALIAGTYPEDIAFAEALERSARKFGLSIDDRKTWAFDADMRRNASQEVPLFTQDLKSADVILVADEVHDFGRYVLYNTWSPQVIAGSEGLTPQTWSPVVEQWGAAQLQSRFEKQSGRPMASRDYAAWAALRTLGEAVTRTGSADAATLRGYILSNAFELAGFKGRPQTFRVWNGQMRQPIPVVHPRALVAQPPLEGFLHRRTELDTLGLDEAESACAAFRP